MEKQALKTCPLCGTKLSVDGKPLGNVELLNEMQELKEQGILAQTMFVAVKIIKSMNGNNPAWFKEILDEHNEDLKDEIQKRLEQEIRPIMREISELKGSPQTMGKAQEMAIAKRLSALKTGEDVFTTEKSGKSGEDVECIVIEQGIQLGKIVIESKKTKRWQEESVEQIRTYMDKENTEFGIVATTTIPDDSLSHTTWKDGVLIVKLDYIEPAYIFIREYLKLKKHLEDDFAAKLAQLDVKEQVLQELKDAITSGQLDSIIASINDLTINIDGSVAKIENNLQRLFRAITKDTSKIREFTARLVAEHIEKIRVQLVNKLGG
jgi:uncharacterized protein YdcH (DUF465 family)